MGTPRRTAARLVDVAAAVGLHHSVVSRILTGDPTLATRPDTRSRVFAKAEELGYRPNAVARSLKSSRAGAVGVLIPSLRNPLWSEVTRGVLSRASGLGLTVLIAEVPDNGDVSSYERLLDQGRVDGLLVVSADMGAPQLGEQTGVPVLHLVRAAKSHVGNVIMDEELAVRLLVSHLVALGHTSIVHIDGPSDIDTVIRRCNALRAEPGLVSLRILHSSFDEVGGNLAMVDGLAFRRALDPPTAVTVAGFNQLIGGLAAIREAGLSVPHELSVGTFDEDPLLDYLDIKVTSVSMPLFELGRVAMEELSALIAGSDPRDIELDRPMMLVDRGSVEAPLLYP